MCFCLFMVAAARPRIPVSFFFLTFRLIKQFMHLRGLHLEAKDPVNARLRCWKPRALLANICSHCELLACNTSSTRRKNTVARAHTRSQNRHAGTNLSFLFHWWVSGSQWETLAPAVLSAWLLVVALCIRPQRSMDTRHAIGSVGAYLWTFVRIKRRREVKEHYVPIKRVWRVYGRGKRQRKQKNLLQWQYWCDVVTIVGPIKITVTCGSSPIAAQLTVHKKRQQLCSILHQYGCVICFIPGP